MITRDAAGEPTVVDDVDPLTGCFIAEAGVAIRPGSSVASLDVTDFWEFDQTIGEQVLHAMGSRLRDRLSPFRVYRGNLDDHFVDSFLIEIDTPLNLVSAELLAAKIVAIVGEPIEEVGTAVEAVVGISLPRPEGDEDTAADRALVTCNRARALHRSWMIEEGNDDGLPRIDDDPDLVWGRRVSSGDEREILPTHPWIGRAPLSDGPEVAVGSAWTAGIDLLAEEDDDRGWLLFLRGARMLARHHGRQVEAAEVDGLFGSWHPLVLIPAGTQLRLMSVSGWSDHLFDSTGATLQFAMRDGRRFTLTTREWCGGNVGGNVGMTWSDILVAAVVVPIDHPVARDDVFLEEVVARITALAGRAADA